MSDTQINHPCPPPLAQREYQSNLTVGGDSGSITITTVNGTGWLEVARTALLNCKMPQLEPFIPMLIKSPTSLKIIVSKFVEINPCLNGRSEDDQGIVSLSPNETLKIPDKIKLWNAIKPTYNLIEKNRKTLEKHFERLLIAKKSDDRFLNFPCELSLADFKSWITNNFIPVIQAKVDTKRINNNLTDDHIQKYADTIFKAAYKYDLDPRLIMCLILQESKFAPDAISKSYARGLMQVKSSTARAVIKSNFQDIYKDHQENLSNDTIKTILKDPSLNVEVGAAYLRNLIDLCNGNKLMAIAMYNCGPTTFITHDVSTAADYYINGKYAKNGTLNYLNKILGAYALANNLPGDYYGGKPLQQLVAHSVPSHARVNTAIISSQIAYNQDLPKLKPINDAQDANELEEALKNNADTLGLDLSRYKILYSRDRTSVTQNILRYKPTGGFKTPVLLQRSLDKAIDDLAIGKINGAPNGDEVSMAIFLHKNLLEIENYFKFLENAQKPQAANSVYNKMPMDKMNYGYKTLAAFQAAYLSPLGFEKAKIEGISALELYQNGDDLYKNAKEKLLVIATKNIARRYSQKGKSSTYIFKVTTSSGITFRAKPGLSDRTKIKDEDHKDVVIAKNKNLKILAVEPRDKYIWIKTEYVVDDKLVQGYVAIGDIDLSGDFGKCFVYK